MVEAKEMVINGILATMRRALDTVQMQILEQTVRENLRGYRLEEECTEPATKMDDNRYILEVFAANKKLEGLEDKSIEHYVRSSNTFMEWINKNYRDVTKDDVKMYLAFYGRGKKQNTIANMKRYLSTFFSWLHDEGYITKNPVKTIKGVKPEEVEHIYLSLEEEIAVRDVMSKKSIRNRAIIDFMLSTGVRVGELVQMNRKDVDLRDGSVTFRGEKSKKYRTVYLDARAKKHLAEYLIARGDTSEALFVTERNYKNAAGQKEPKRMGKLAYENIAKDAAVEAGITDKVCTVHVYRKTFATRMAERGCPLEIIQELLGHADAGTTSKHYVAKSKQRIKKECEKYMAA